MPKSKKIIMVDDDIFLRKIYRDQLTRAGFDFIEATNGIEGMNKILSEKPDLVLLDLMLPLKNGFDVLTDIKNNKETKKIPVIILSNLGQESDINEAKMLGAQNYLIKNEVKLSKVVEEVQKLLSA